MAQIYSTLQRESGKGQPYSTLAQGVRSVPTARSGLEPVASPVSRPVARPVPQPRATQVATPSHHMAFRLGSVLGDHLPGSAPSGSVRLTGRPGEAYQVEAELHGIAAPPDPQLQPTLWLIHDLVVPREIHPQDLALLPKGQTGWGNQPGGPFTIDGNPPTYGLGANTLPVVISLGRFLRTDDGVYRLQGLLDQQTNRTFHPLVLAGPIGVADMNASLPSGVTAELLRQLFLRPATVAPELPVGVAYQQRLPRILAGLPTGEEPGQFLDARAFTRAAVTLEGLVRAQPELMPTREATLLVSVSREEG